MFCHQCGNNCQDDHTFCVKCGTKVYKENKEIEKETEKKDNERQCATEQPNDLLSQLPQEFRQTEIGQKAATGTAAAQYQVARRFLTGTDGFSLSISSCLFWLNLASLGGDPDAQCMLGSFKLMGENTALDSEGGMKLLTQAADKGHLSSLVCLQTIYKNGIPGFLSPDPQKAIDYLFKLVDMGHVESHFILACHYFEGEGLPSDVSIAFKLWKYAADNEHPESQKNIAKCYEDGIGTKRDETAAREYLIAAANNGDQEAIKSLGYRLMKGTGGFEQNVEQAKLCMAAIRNQSPEAFAQYALCLIRSNDAQERQEGLEMLENRAREGDGEAAFVLANCYANGEREIEEDFLKTLSYLQLAAESGHPLAVQALENINMKKEPGSTQYKYVEPPKKPSFFSKFVKKNKK